jgi:hypothetical protein
VPFQAQGNPLGQVIETALVRKLRDLANDIAVDADSRPRWVFLVGGPGNGKSETVQDFLAHLDASLDAGGALIAVLRQAFARPGLLPRKVEVFPGDLAGGQSQFAAKVGRLVVVQDATATESAMGNAAMELADDLADLLTSPPTSLAPVFVACANRGLLARAMNEAARSFGNSNPVTQLLASVLHASSLGPEVPASRPCWPLANDARFACWPLDLDSLVTDGGAVSPLEFILRRATEPAEWETDGRCRDCASRPLCPFRQSADWLRDDTTRANLLTLLRRGELARGQRWNFRDAFSLAAELLVGQWSDFDAELHPCAWVHREQALATANPPAPGSVLSLALQLYPHGMFRGGPSRDATVAFVQQRLGGPQLQQLTHDLLSAFAARDSGASIKPIRETLARDYHRLDPAASTPAEPGHMLRLLEEAFCQSVEQGRSAAQQAGLAPSEDLLLAIVEKAEEEWDLLGRESAIAVNAVCVLRMIAGVLSKRSAGVRLGYYALDRLLADYEAALRDASLLATVRAAIQPLLGTAGSSFNLLEILGQPTGEKQPLVSLQGPSPGVRPIPAPLPTASTPGHDMPFIEFTDPTYRVPLTFDFFMALRLRKEGCAGSSLPASVRAALDRIRHRFAGELCRKDELFVDGRASIALATGQRIGLPGPGQSPVLVPD